MMDVVLGENKLILNYIRNVYDERYPNRVIAWLTFSDKEGYKYSKEEIKWKGDSGMPYMKSIKNDCDVCLTFSNKESIDNMINMLIELRDSTDWEWRNKGDEN